MKLLHVSDLHFRINWFAWVTAQARHYDAVCVAGDLLDMFGTAKISLRAQAKWTREWLRNFPGRLFVCSGNHDWWGNNVGVGVDPDAHGGWLDKLGRPEVTVDGQGATCGKFFIWCHAFRAPPVWPQAPAGRWILLHHLPPALAATATGGTSGKDQGCQALAAALTTGARPPWIVLSGHLHKPKSWRGRCGSSWSLNPTFDEQAAIPNHIIIDTATGTVTWVTERAGTWPLQIL